MLVQEKASEPAVARLQAGIAWDTRATWKLQPRLKVLLVCLADLLHL